MVLKRFMQWAESCYKYHLENSDPRVLAWPMVDKDLLNLFIVVCYLLLVTLIGPRIMKNRKPFNLRRVMVPYNIALVVVNFYIFQKYVKLRYFTERGTGCIPLRISNSPQQLQLAEITWWYYITKYIELSDTVFFVLRKKEHQLSKLHLIHHSAVPIVIWALLRFEPGGYNTFFPQANSFVHCVMYVYYTMAAMGDDEKEVLWFKKYVTMTQLVQFIIVLLYFFSQPFNGCKVSLMAFSVNVFIAGFFFILFCNFYYHAYVLEEDKKRKQNHYLNGSIHQNGSKSIHLNGSESTHQNGSKSIHLNGSESVHQNGSKSFYENGSSFIYKNGTECIHRNESDSVLENGSNSLPRNGSKSTKVH